ncbi:MAG: phosphotransferase family protein [Acidimicrobiales bacterium]
MPAPTTAGLADALGRRLGGTVRDLRRLSGGASRITSSFDLEPPGGAPRPLILQQDRGDGAGPGGRAGVEAALLRAAHGAGVPVPRVVALGRAGGEAGAPGTDADALGADWLVVERVAGETIPRKILRDPEWAGARRALTAQCGQALAAIHAIDPATIDGLSPHDPLGDPRPYLDALGQPRPALELGWRWLEAHRPAAGPRVTVHGDFRTGNLLVGPEGLRAVLDWELAHAGDPAEDIGWLCAPAWRFGGPGAVGGFGSLDELLGAYAAAGGGEITPARVRWWEVFATVKWAVICALQASAHLSGATRSVELAAIGRRVCESEWDLFTLLGVAPAGTAEEDAKALGGDANSADRAPAGDPGAPFGRPTAAELVEAVGEYLESTGMAQSDGGARFTARIARNALHTVERELRLGPALAAAHARRLAGLGFDDDGALASALRSGSLDHRPEVGPALAAAARDQLLVANPAYLERSSA